MRSYIRRRGDVAAAEMARDRAQSRQHQLDIKVKPTGQHFMAAIALTDSAMAIAASYAARVIGSIDSVRFAIFTLVGFRAALRLARHAFDCRATPKGAQLRGLRHQNRHAGARRLCPAVITVEANHRRYTDYHERILKAVDTCLPATSVPEFARLFAGESWIRTIGTCKISYRFETDI